MFLPNRRFELLLVYVGCIYPVGCRDLYVCWIKINTLEEVSSCWSLLSALLVLLWMSRYRCVARKISLVNEVLVGLEWRGLIGQHEG